MALVLRPEAPLGEWLNGLDALLERSPGYFTTRPVMVDLSALSGEGQDIVELMQDLAKRDIRVMAIEGQDRTSLGDAADKLPPLVNDVRPAKDKDIPSLMPATPVAANEDTASPQPATTVERTAPSLIVDKSLRSGQSINFAAGDVTVLGSVASGAEIVAGG